LSQEGRGVFSPCGDPEACARARPSSACVPAGGLPIPSHARASAAWWGAARCEAKGGEGKKEKGREAGEWVPVARGRKENEEGAGWWAAWFDRPAGPVGLAS
jgi:hypothetical protein